MHVTAQRATGDAEEVVRVPLRFGWLRPLCFVFGMSGRRSGVSIGAEDVEVRAGPWFRARFPRRVVVAVESAPPRCFVIGVHTWRGGTWIVNGAASPMARLVLAGPIEARTLGFRVHPRRIEVSVDDPAALAEALGHVLAPGSPL
jgi:hypothetical protein